MKGRVKIMGQSKRKREKEKELEESKEAGRREKVGE
jgi:hypothetical protein